jgi:general secretion pathway protein A
MNELFYGEFYGFDSPPFHTTPDSSVLFATETHHQAIGAIEYGIASGKGFIVITGEVGVGKTTVLRSCIDRLDAGKTKVIYVFNPDLKPSELYQTILDDFDESASGGKQLTNPLHRVQRALLKAHGARQQVILAIDEAQNMPEATLEALRMLSNFETARSKLLQIILVGQPELEVILAKHSMRQLTQRIAVRARIRALSWRQSCRYIRHRIQCAGRTTTAPLFTKPALWYLAFRSKGIPRTINISCDNALISGYGAAAERISLQLVYESCRSLGTQKRLGYVGALAAVVLLTVPIMAAGVFRAGFGAGFSTPLSVTNTPPRVATTPNDTAAVAALVTAAPAMPAQAPAVATAAPAMPAQAPAVATAAPAPIAPVSTPPVSTGPAGSDPAATLPAATSVAAAAAPIAAEPTRSDAPVSKEQPSFWKWRVRRGDTLAKLCRNTYGQCDPDAMQGIYDYNPELRSDHTLRVGQIIVMPERSAASGSD